MTRDVPRNVPSKVQIVSSEVVDKLTIDGSGPTEVGRTAVFFGGGGGGLKKLDLAIENR